MPKADIPRCRLCLVTPVDADPSVFASALGHALAGGDVASLIITAHPANLQALAEACVPIAEARGVATIVHGDTRIAGRARADGVQIDSGLADLKEAAAAFRPKKIVGAGGVRSRHDAMVVGEADPDYIFFGRLDGDRDDLIFDSVLDLAAWWSSMFVIPAIVMGGATIASVRDAADAGVEFVALGRAVWTDPRGPGAAVAGANEILAAPVGATP